MWKLLIRLYLVTIVSYSAAIYLMPELVVRLFHDRFLTYNLDYSRGLQTLMVKQFRAVPSEQWPALAAQMDKEFEPLRIELAAFDDGGFSAEEQARLKRGENVVRIGDWAMAHLGGGAAGRAHGGEDGRAAGPG